MNKINLDDIREQHLRLCGNCDAGLPMNCTCPLQDPRNAISRLVDHIEYLYSNYDLLTASTMSEAVDKLDQLQECQDTLRDIRRAAERGSYGTDASDLLLRSIVPGLLRTGLDNQVS